MAPKESKRELKGNQNEQRDGKNASKFLCSPRVTKSIAKKAAACSIRRSLLGWFSQKIHLKIDTKIDVKKRSELSGFFLKIMPTRDPESMTNPCNFRTCDFYEISAQWFIQNGQAPENIMSEQLFALKGAKTKPKCEPKRSKWSQKRGKGSQKGAQRVPTVDQNLPTFGSAC